MPVFNLYVEAKKAIARDPSWFFSYYACILFALISVAALKKPWVMMKNMKNCLQISVICFFNFKTLLPQAMLGYQS
jgi:uncharacterized membrane protein YhaH (DUF805 family)